ncbi:E3 ubiquitin-protein ligase EL5-like [Miscanthus floridulus]|uniref:E3 ubiquitin-protein ligase EL5-like n=1 Tax=Miscanthus floridulus TaxID=154761 RepID=UPI0034598786
MDHSMATTTSNAAGGSKIHLSSLQHGSAYGQAYYSQNSGEPGDANDNVMPIVFVAITGLVVLLRLLCCGFRKDEEEQATGGLADRDPSTVAAVEVPPVRWAEPPLVCTYRKEDGCGEDSCGVCLAELADGEAIRVLPACMHFFHAACVNEWLRGHDTCPLCRAPLIAPGPSDDT